MSTRVSLDDIRAAAVRIAGGVARTPFATSETLAHRLGCTLWLKEENQQFTASFKERGALNRILQMTKAERARGVITVSAGNHAQALAHHATKAGIAATVVMPEATPFVKVRNTKVLGARIELHGRDFDEATARCHEIAAAEGQVVVPPFDDPAIIAGQGTIGLEMLEAVPDLDMLVIPVGGGGLIGGIATAAKALNPRIHIVGVQSAQYPAMLRALGRYDGPLPGGATIAEGIAVKTPGTLTRAIIEDLVDDLVMVAESVIEQAIVDLLEIEKTVVEGAGAAGLAAIMDRPHAFKGKRVATVLCGGNIDSRLLGQAITRVMRMQGRITTLRLAAPDGPGLLSQTAAIIAAAGANILDVRHGREDFHQGLRMVELGITIETMDPGQGRAVLGALRAAGFQVLD